MRGLVSLVLLSAAACASLPRGPAPTAESLADRLRSGRLDQLAADADIEWFAKERVRFRAVLAARRPSAFRIEVLSPFEEPLHILASDGASLVWQSRDAYRRGPATPSNLALLIPIELAPSDLVDVLLGGLPQAEWRVARVTPVARPTAWRLELEDPSGRRIQVWVDPEEDRVLKAVFPEPGIEARFSDFVRVSGAWIPRAVRVKTVDAEVRIRLSDPTSTSPLPDAVFRLPPGPGVPVLPLVEAELGT